jgi:creatinine amidohydrolase
MNDGRNDLLEMLPGEIETRLVGGSDIVLLPVGSLEQHGPHLPLWTDGFFAQALAREIGRLSSGTVLPAVPFSWVGCTNAFSGGIGVRQAVFVQYLRAVIRSLWQSGFRRIVVINGHGGNFYAMRSLPHDIYREDGIPMLCIFGTAGCKEAEEILERAGGGEATEVTGALRLLGREDLLREVQEYTRRAVAEFGDCTPVQLEPAAAREARRLGVVGHDYSHECLHVAPDSRLDPEAGVAAIRAAAAHITGVLDAMRGYVRSLD